jgi:hypothetical protein
LKVTAVLVRASAPTNAGDFVENATCAALSFARCPCAHRHSYCRCWQVNARGVDKATSAAAAVIAVKRATTITTGAATANN